MPENKQVIIDFKIEASEALQATVALTDKLNQLKQTKKELEKQLKEDSGNLALKEQLANVNAQIGATSSSLRGYQKELANAVKINNSETNSLDQQRAVLSNLTAQWDRLSEAERNSTRGVNLKAQIDTTMSSVKGLEESTDRFQRNVGAYTKSAKQALRELTIELQNLALQNNQTQGEIKAQEAALQSLSLTVGKDSQEYQQAAERLEQLKTAFNDSKTAMAQMEQKAGEMRDTIGDVNQRINSFANDQQKIAAAQEGVKVLTGSYALLQTGMKALGISSESLLQVWAKVELVQKSMNALMTISKALNKDSNLMIVLRSQLTKTQTAYQTAYNTALAATNTAEGVGVKLAPKVAAGFKGIGAAIKSIPGVAWITAIISALTILIPKLKNTNKELDNSAKAVKGISVGATEATVKLQISVDYLKTCKEGTEQWTGAIGDVATQLGVSEEWLKKHINDIDTITSKWVESQIVMAQVQSQIAKIVDLENQKGDIQNQFQQLRNLASMGKRSAAKNIAKELGGDVDDMLTEFFTESDRQGDSVKNALLNNYFGKNGEIRLYVRKNLTEPLTNEIENVKNSIIDLYSETNTPTTKTPKTPDTEKRIKEQQEVEDAIFNLTADEHQKLIKEVDKYYDELVKKANGNNKQILEIERLRSIAIAKVYTDEITKGLSGFDEGLKQVLSKALESLQDFRKQSNLWDEVAKLADENDYATQMREAKSNSERLAIAAKFAKNRLDIAQMMYDNMSKQEGESEAEFNLRQQQQLKQLNEYKAQYDSTSAAIAADTQKMMKSQLDMVGAFANATTQMTDALIDALSKATGDEEKYQKWKLIMSIVEAQIQGGLAIMSAITTATPGDPYTVAARIASAAAAAGAATIAAVAQLVALKGGIPSAPKFATGGLVTGPGSGTSDSILARLSNGESVMTARTTQMFAPMLSAMNVAGGGAPITDTQRNQSFNEMWQDAFANMPAPVVSVKEITNVSNRLKLKENISKQ